jgi:hypothetical protein
MSHFMILLHAWPPVVAHDVLKAIHWGATYLIP